MVYVSELYQHFLVCLRGLVNGSVDSTKYEDECRQLMGTGSYLLFSLDRVVAHAVKQLQILGADSSATKLRVRTHGFMAWFESRRGFICCFHREGVLWCG